MHPHPRQPVVLALLLLSVGCKEDAPSPDAGAEQRTLEAVKPYGPDVGLKPGQETLLKVRYLDGAGRGIPGAEVRFAIFGDPHGSTLSSDRGVTDGAGDTAITLRAGPGAPRFQVQASAALAKTAVFYIEVSDGAFGALAFTPRYGGELPRIQLATATYFLLSDGSCQGVDPLSPVNVQRTRAAASLDQVVVFEALPLDLGHRFLARAATAAGKVMAAGCVEVPIGVLQADKRLQLSLQVSDLLPRTAGTYTLESTLTMATSGSKTQSWPRPLAEAIQPWTDLADCHNDPAQLLLDCILDARDSGDPLDCVVASPSAQTAALQAERGVLSAGCRGEKTDRGTPSLDKQIQGLLEIGAPSLVAALAKVEAQLRELLSVLQLAGTLKLGALDASGTTAAVHTLASVTLGVPGHSTSFKASEIGLPAWRADPVKATVKNWQLKLAKHPLSLRLGAVGRMALSRAVLLPASLPTDSAALAAKLANSVSATSGSKKYTSCAAIEAVACQAARLGPGCLGQACNQGLAALAARLDSGFAALDAHQKADLELEGSVPLQDSDGDLKVDALGSTTVPGIWTMRMQLADHLIVPLEAIFVGKKK